MLAAIPSIIFGMWGIFVIVPFMAKHVEPWIQSTPLGRLPGIIRAAVPGGGSTSSRPASCCAFMILPFITAVSRDVLKMVPHGRQGGRLRHGLHDLGGHAQDQHALRQLAASSAPSSSASAARSARPWPSPCVIGSNCFTTCRTRSSSPAPPSPRLIALHFGEAPTKLETSALIELGLILFVITDGVPGGRAALAGAARARMTGGRA